MRHGKKINHLGRKSAHRKALMSNMASSLILHKRISTTVAKAKELRKYVEPLLTKSKDDTTHSRRIVFSYLGHKEAIIELFDKVASKIANRPGGYTRIIKTGTRLGDNAETCIIELVDYNEIYQKEDKKKAARRRTRRSGTKKDEGMEVKAPEVKATKQDAIHHEEAPVETTTEEVAAENAEDPKQEENPEEKKEQLGEE